MNWNNYKHYKKINKIKSTLKATSLFKHCYRLSDHQREISVWKITVELNETKNVKAKAVCERQPLCFTRMCMNCVLMQKEIFRGPRINRIRVEYTKIGIHFISTKLLGQSSYFYSSVNNTIGTLGLCQIIQEETAFHMLCPPCWFQKLTNPSRIMPNAALLQGTIPDSIRQRESLPFLGGEQFICS